MMKRIRLIRGVVVLSCAALMLSGCATAGKARLQTVNVNVADGKGSELTARCTLRNGAGDWQLNAPGAATVVVDAEPLRISCTSEDGKQAGEASLERKSTTGRNALIGAGVGLAVGGAIGANKARRDSSSNDFGTALFAGLAIVGGVVYGLIAGTGAGAATGENGYADAVRVTLKPLPKPATP